MHKTKFYIVASVSYFHWVGLCAACAQYGSLNVRAGVGRVITSATLKTSEMPFSFSHTESVLNVICLLPALYICSLWERNCARVPERAHARVSASDFQCVKHPAQPPSYETNTRGCVAPQTAIQSSPLHSDYRVAAHESWPLDTPAECATQPLAHDSFLLKDAGQLQCQALRLRRGHGEGIAARAFVRWARFLSQWAAAQDSGSEVYTD